MSVTPPSDGGHASCCREAEPGGSHSATPPPQYQAPLANLQHAAVMEDEDAVLTGCITTDSFTAQLISAAGRGSAASHCVRATYVCCAKYLVQGSGMPRVLLSAAAHLNQLGVHSIYHVARTP